MIRQGDDTDAFGSKFLKIVLKDAENYTITKAEVRIGVLIKTFDNPVFPLEISLNREETSMLSTCGNDCYMAIYDTENKKKTLNGTLRFNVSPKVV